MNYLKYLSPILFFAFICYIIVIADSDQDHFLIDLAESLRYGDKIAHLVLYGGFSGLLNLALGNRTWELVKVKIPIGSIAVLVFAVLEEFSQLAFPSRTFDWMDIGCDVLGIIGSALLIKEYRSKLGQWVLRWVLLKK